MHQFRITLTGASPLLMHNEQLADEFNVISREMKKITAKKTKKTDDDRLELRRLEFMGSLYYDPEVGPYVPGLNIERSLVEAARLTRAGKSVERGLRITSDFNPVQYAGPRDRDALWAEGDKFRLTKGVKVTTSRIIRTRPMFRNWTASAEGVYDPEMVDLDSLTIYAQKAGLYVGLGDWRPRYGLFDAKVEAL